MCGIVGYIGNKQAAPIIVKCIDKLQYRGYDSVGISTVSDNKILIKKDQGKLDEVDKSLNLKQLAGTTGLGHSRWATHGEPNYINAHPHTDCKGEIALVHNGIIENFSSIKKSLIEKGHKFKSETDSEVVVHLIEEYSEGNFLEGFRKAVKALEGSYALAVISTRSDALYLARSGSPLVIGIGKGEMFCASDIPALLDHTRNVIFMEDGETAVLTRDKVTVYDKYGKNVEKQPSQVDWTADMAMKEGYDHFMLKEIEEQRNTVRQSLTNDEEIAQAVKLMKQYKKFQVVASGTSYYAGLVFKFLIQKLAKAQCEAIIGSEYPYSTVVDRETMVIAISQSGETADTLRAVKEAKNSGAKVLAITNVVGSTLTREADKTVYMRAGPEISVVATKTYTSQLAVLSHIVFKFINNQELDEKLKEVWQTVEQALTKDREIQDIAKKLKNLNNFFFIGRGIDFPSALEGALKLKEITYLHAEGYPGGELKHGPLSLLEKNVPVIAIVSGKETEDKMIGNIKECKARGALLIGVSNSDQLLEHVDIRIKMPEVHPLLAPIAYAIPIQLLAYYIAVLNGRDPDKPRNLAKSLTVE